MGQLVAILVSLVFLGLFLVLPLVVVFAEALSNGVGAYLASFQDPDAVAAIKLTLTVAAIAVPLNLVFGIAASWAIAKFEFRGQEPADHLDRSSRSRCRRSSPVWCSCCCSARRGWRVRG